MENEVARLAGVACVVVAMALFGLFVAAMFLRAACALFNKLAGANSVPVPTFAKALGILAVTHMIGGVIGFLLGLGVASGVAASGGSHQMAQVVTQIVTLPIGILVMTMMFKAFLPTSFGKAILVVLLNLAIAIAIVLVMTVAVLAVVLLISALAGR